MKNCDFDSISLTAFCSLDYPLTLSLVGSMIPSHKTDSPQTPADDSPAHASTHKAPCSKFRSNLLQK